MYLLLYHEHQNLQIRCLDVSVGDPWTVRPSRLITHRCSSLDSESLSVGCSKQLQYANWQRNQTEKKKQMKRLCVDRKGRSRWQEGKEGNLLQRSNGILSWIRNEHEFGYLVAASTASLDDLWMENIGWWGWHERSRWKVSRKLKWRVEERGRRQGDGIQTNDTREGAKILWTYANTRKMRKARKYNLFFRVRGWQLDFGPTCDWIPSQDDLLGFLDQKVWQNIL